MTRPLRDKRGVGGMIGSPGFAPMHSKTRISLLALCLALAAAPAGAALFGGDDIARKGVAEQSKRVDVLSTRHDELSARLGRLEEALKAQAGATTQPLLDLASQMQALRDELRNLRGQIEVLSNSVDANAKRQRDMYVDLDTRLRRLEQTPQPGAPPAGAAPAGAPAPGAAPSPAAAAATGAPAVASAPAPAAGAVASGSDEAKAYEAAQNQRRIGNYQAAIVAFQTFVLQYPRSPLAHRAQYWIGDSYFNLRDYKNTISNQQRLLATYPESASVPDAMLNMASAQFESGDAAGSRKTMETLVARHPTSDAAEKARRRLATGR